MKVGEQVSERRRHHEKSESLDVTQEQVFEQKNLQNECI